MNCPTRDYNSENEAGYNQNPPEINEVTPGRCLTAQSNGSDNSDRGRGSPDVELEEQANHELQCDSCSSGHAVKKVLRKFSNPFRRVKLLSASRYWSVFTTYLFFVGPGLMISVAYMDPGNYSTAVAAGSEFQFALLFVILLSNIIACFLQSLAAKLGSATGTDICTLCRLHYPNWVCYILYFFFECAIIATGIAEVIGAAIALNILLSIPLPAGCAITVVDSIFVLFFYKPNGGFRGIRFFELFVACLVLGVFICFCVELSELSNSYTIDVGAIFKGYLPSKTVFSAKGIYPSIGILGATVMPHSIILGTSLVIPRVRNYDVTRYGLVMDECGDLGQVYYPSIEAVRDTLSYSIAEVVISLCTMAVFVNSAVLIVAGVALYYPDNPQATADLFSIKDLLSNNLGAAAGTLFAVALLFSGISSSIIATIVGQTISEGFWYDKWRIKPWQRRLVTRLIAIIPCLVVSITVGREGLGDALNASQVVLSCLLPFVSFPLIHFTSSKKIMTITRSSVMSEDDQALDELSEDDNNPRSKSPSLRCDGDEAIEGQNFDLSNTKLTSFAAWAVWLLILGLNVSIFGMRL